METDSSPLLTDAGAEPQQPGPLDKLPCSKKQLLIITAVVLTLALAGILIGVVPDWDNSSGKGGGGDDDDQHTEKEWEEEFLAIPDGELIREYTVELASEPHIASYPAQFTTGYAVEARLASFGFQTQTQNWTGIYLSHFAYSGLRMLVPVVNQSESEADDYWYEFDLAEAVIDSDPDTDNEVRTQAFNAYAHSGNVSGPLVYVNYGRRVDYLALSEMGVDVSACIGLARYGQGGRSGKVKLAQEFGLAGLILFMDPSAVAPDLNLVYPDGPWLPETGFQRGSIKFSSCPGNPDPDRLADLCGETTEEALPSIPVIPLSYGNALRIFQNLGGLYATDVEEDDGVTNGSWTTGIVIDERIGGRFDASPEDELSVNLEVINDLHTDDTIMNVYGFMEGTVFPDEIVMVGAHRDSWVNGACDDVSGTATMLEIARSFGVMYADGWRPRRTIYMASWDGEESGLIGSTLVAESTESIDTEITSKLVTYINLDMTVAGPRFGASGHPLLDEVVLGAMHEVFMPYLAADDDRTLAEQWTMDGKTSPGLVGAGSDYVGFMYYLGTPCVDTGFGGTSGTYHSAYDTVGWMDVIDEDWLYAEAIAQYAGLLTLRLIDTHVLPFQLTGLVDRMDDWFHALQALAQSNDACTNDSLSSGNWDALSEAITRFGLTVSFFNSEIDKLDEEDSDEHNANGDSTEDEDDDEVYLSEVARLNSALKQIGQRFTLHGVNNVTGLQERIWHQNLLWDVAPETGPTNVFPYTYYALENTCDDAEAVDDAFDVTITVINSVKDFLDTFVITV